MQLISFRPSEALLLTIGSNLSSQWKPPPNLPEGRLMSGGFKLSPSGEKERG